MVYTRSVIHHAIGVLAVVRLLLCCAAAGCSNARVATHVGFAVSLPSGNKRAKLSSSDRFLHQRQGGISERDDQVRASSALTTMGSSVGANAAACVVVDDVADGNAQQFLQRSNQLATDLSLPLVYASSFAVSRDAAASDEVRLSHVESCSHALMFLSLESCDLLVASTKLMADDQQYALGIVPMNQLRKSKPRRRRPPNRSQTPTRQSSEHSAVIIPRTYRPWIVEFPIPDVSQMHAMSNKGRPGKDLLVHAVFHKRSASRNNPPVIVDLTAGWGSDAWVLLLAGAAHVTLVERNPIVAALLQDGLRRLHQFEQIKRERQRKAGPEALTKPDHDYSSRMKVLVGDGIHIASQLLALTQDSNTTPDTADTPLSTLCPRRPDVVYLDPMFPPRTKSAAVKKNMNILHSLLARQEVGDSQTQQQATEDYELLRVACALARERVVVKRPLHLPTGLGGSVPSYSVRGSTHRWDVYVVSSS